MPLDGLLRIASFDAGGARSIFQLEIMRAIMDQARRIDHPDDPNKVMLPCQYFDVIGGTDTGGLIAVMLTALRMSVEEAITELRIIVEKVYTNKLAPAEKTKALRDCMEVLLIKRNFPVDLRLVTGDSAEAMGFVATKRMRNGALMFLQTQHGPTRFTVVETVLATCASQPEFLPLSVPNDLDYVGPGLKASNPIHHVITEALCVDDRPPFNGRPRPHFITLLLSLGSGTPGMLPSIRRHYGHHAYSRRKHSVTQDELARKILERANKDGTYFRFSLEQETQGRNLELDADERSRIATQLDLYLRNEDTVKRIEDSVSILINPDAAAEKVALTYYTKGLYDEAERIQGHVGQHRLLKLGNKHPSTIRARENLVMVILEQCKWVEAEKEQLNLLELQRAIHGTQHPCAIETAATLMTIYSEREDWEKAEELQLEILEQKRQILGKDHPEAVRAAATLTSIYHMQGKWNEAKQLGLEVLERRQEIFGEDHPDTILAAQCVDAIFRAPKEAETARRWKLNLAGAVEERVNSSLRAMFDAETDSSYPHTSLTISKLNPYATKDSLADSGMEKMGGKLKGIDLDTSNEDPAAPIGANQTIEGHQRIMEAVRLWYHETGPLAEERNEIMLSSTGHSYCIQLVALNFELSETSIMVDKNSTLSQIGFQIYTSNSAVLPVALEQTSGPFPRWRIPNINSRVPQGVQKIYVADINDPFTLALVRDVDEDFPLLLPFVSFDSSATSVSDLIGSSLGERAKTWASIRLLSSSDDIQRLPCDIIRKGIKGIYSTTLFVLLNDDPLVYKFRNDHGHPSPLPLKMALLQCRALVNAASHMDAFALQAIHLSRALLHLIIRLVEAVNLSSMDETIEAHHISKLKKLVVKLNSIFTDIGGLTDATFESVKVSLVEFYDEICEERPGVVAVRQSLKSLRALTMLDLRNQGRWSEISDVSFMVQKEEPLEQDLGNTRDMTSERPSGANGSDSSDSLSSSDHRSDASLEIEREPASHDLQSKLKELESIPLFMKNLSDDLSNQGDALEALQALIHDGTPDEIAANFKTQGNEYIRAKRYREAMGFYSQAIDAKPSDPVLLESLLLNRAVCNLELKNYGSVLRDCSKVLSTNQGSLKALYRSALALIALERPIEALDCCERGLRIDPESDGLKGTQARAQKLREEQDMRERMKIEKLEAKKRDEQRLVQALKLRNIIVVQSAPGAPSTDMRPVLTADDPPNLSIPVILLYPQYSQSDIISSFYEHSVFTEHLDVMFPPGGARPGWDLTGDYLVHNLVLYAQTKRKRLLKIGKKMTLASLCQSAAAKPSDEVDGLEMVDGHLSIIVLLKGDVEKRWIDDFKRERGF